MDPILFKEYLNPLSKHGYNVDELLKICYPLRGVWDWSMLENADNSIIRIFKLVHNQIDSYLLIESDWITDTYIKDCDQEGYEYDERWGICWKKEEREAVKDSYLFVRLEELLEDSESSKTPEWDDYGTSSDETSEEHTVSLDSESSIKEIEFSTIERDQKWKDNNPAFNPRFKEDLEKGYLELPRGFKLETVFSIIDGVKQLEDSQFLAADGSGDILDSGIQEFGLYGKPRCMKSVKLIRFFEQHSNDYSLDIDASQWVEKAEKRTNIWKWIRVGPGFYRDFDWMFMGDQDCITKTINVMVEMGYKPLSEHRISGHKFDFDPSRIFKLSSGKSLDIDTGKEVRSKKTDSYGFVTKDTSKNRVQKIRGFIFDYFKEQYPNKMIPGKKNKWVKEFFGLLKDRVIIDFESLKPIKYTAATNSTHHFSKMGFALSKEEKNFRVKDIEQAIKKYKS